METFLQTIIVTFVSIAAIVCLVAVAIGYVIDKAVGSGPGFISTELEHGNAVSGSSDDLRPVEVIQESLPAGERSFAYNGSMSRNSRKTALDGPGDAAATSLARSPCRFCRRVRDALRNAWNRP